MRATCPKGTCHWSATGGARNETTISFTKSENYHFCAQKKSLLLLVSAQKYDPRRISCGREHFDEDMVFQQGFQ